MSAYLPALGVGFLRVGPRARQWSSQGASLFRWGGLQVLAQAANAKQKRGYQEARPSLAINLSFLSTSAPSQGPPFSVTQLTFLNPSTTADPRTRGSVRRASSFVQIAITRIAHYLAFLNASNPIRI